MKWKDLFYFSKGERQALILLLFLITIAFILLIITDNISNENKISSAISKDTIIGTNILPAQEIKPMQSNSQKPNNAPKKRPQNTKNDKSSYTNPQYTKTEKYPSGTIIELNSADTLILKKVPGIGSTFARRIIKYRQLLGGFYSPEQLSEVYGIDDERYTALLPWFISDTALIHKLPINSLCEDSLRRHPYISYQQAKIIVRLRKQKGRLSGWENLHLLEEFSEKDQQKLMYYLSFE